MIEFTYRPECSFEVILINKEKYASKNESLKPFVGRPFFYSRKESEKGWETVTMSSLFYVRVIENDTNIEFCPL